MYLKVNSAEQSFPTSELDSIGFRYFYSLNWWVYLVLNHLPQSQDWVQADRSSSMLFSWVLDRSMAMGICGHFCWLLTPCSELTRVLSEWENLVSPLPSACQSWGLIYAWSCVSSGYSMHFSQLFILSPQEFSKMIIKIVLLKTAAEKAYLIFVYVAIVSCLLIRICSCL